jgi:LuxR family transcriptional regulator, maltose regulon positive regulatory protein
MSTIVLESKLHIPVQPQRGIHRPHLRTALEHQVIRYKLTLLSAPAGYGKTTLLAEWARASKFPVVWLSITQEEDNVERFLRYLLAAWERVQPGIVETPLGILLGSQLPDIKAVLGAFINLASEVPEQLAVVLDDYHLIEDPAIHEALIFLLDHLPANLHFILASRSEPQLPLARYRARGQLVEIRADDLLFTRDEASDFLNRSMELELSSDEVSSLHTATEGWIAGLQLAALAIRRRPGRAAEAPFVSGRQRFIADYLTEDVLNQLPTDRRDFLLRTSLLEGLCGPLCNAVTGQTNGQAMLETLERENLFITPLDDQREWFRYHSLFADYLRGELHRRHTNEVVELHRRAAAWYAAHDLPEQAFHHAVAGDHTERVVEIIDKYFNAKINAGEFKVLEGWVDSIPSAWYAAYPALNLVRAALLAYSGAFEACVRLVDEVEQRLTPVVSENTRLQMARVMGVRCFIACMQNDLAQAEMYANHALRDLPGEDIGFRPGIYGALGDAYRRNGYWEEAQTCYLKALAVAYSPTVRQHAAHVFGALADLQLRQGRLQSAAGYWRKALAAIRENWGRLPLPVIGWVYIRMGELLYEWNELAEAWDHISRGLKRAEMGGDLRSLIAGYVIAARLKLAEGEIERAAEYLEKARPLEEQASFPDWSSQFERTQLELWLAQDKLRAAVNWSDEMSRSAVLEDRPESVVTQLAMARVLIVKGDAKSLGQAYARLERLLDMAEQQGQTGVYIEALVLRAMIDWKRGKREDAMISLESTLRLAEPEGYVRLFVDLGFPMARLLQEARSREVIPEYVEKLLLAFRLTPTHTAAAEAVIPEPLTRRELEVLRLVAAGLTNQEIAEKLVISPETVKKHTGHIYGKLGVSNRTEAASRAQALDLLS